MIEFERHPDAYRHWRLDIKGVIATLALDVDEGAGLMPGFALKMNSYDLGVDFTFVAPHHAFNRRIGVFAGRHALPDGTFVDGKAWEAQRANILPTPGDYEFLRSLMQPVTEPGKMAGWIAPPRRGVCGKPLDYEYVRFD